MTKYDIIAQHGASTPEEEQFARSGIFVEC